MPPCSIAANPTAVPASRAAASAVAPLELRHETDQRLDAL
jgi:hypothetical protein